MSFLKKADFFVLADKVLEDLEKGGKYYPYKNTKVAFGKLEQFEGELDTLAMVMIVEAWKGAFE